MSEPIVISLSDGQVAMLAAAQARYNAAAAQYQSLLDVLIAGADAPAGCRWAVNLRDKRITLTLPEQAA